MGTSPARCSPLSCLGGSRVRVLHYLLTICGTPSPVLLMLTRVGNVAGVCRSDGLMAPAEALGNVNSVWCRWHQGGTILPQAFVSQFGLISSDVPAVKGGGISFILLFLSSTV